MNDMAVSHNQHRITVDEYHHMDSAGVFSHDARIELVDGMLVETIEKMNPRHADVVAFLTSKLARAIGDRAQVRCQLPITLGKFSEPEPDFAIVRGPRSLYKDRHPGPDDILCLIEVSDTSRAFDLRTKAPLYARFGVSETVIVDLVDRCVHVLRVPEGRSYLDTTTVPVDAGFSLLAFPDVSINVADVFG